MADTEADTPEAPAVDPAIVDAIRQGQDATMGTQVLLASGGGRAYQVVAASAAIAIQDATDMLRNISTVSTTAIGVAMAQMLEGDFTAQQTLEAAQEALNNATTNYAAICAAAATSLKGFPQS
jgi:hypothetical protein